MYADDLAIVTSFEKIEKVLKNIDEWALTNSMRINRAKSGIMPLNLRRCKQQKDLTEINGYPITSRYKYLGYHLKNNFSVSAHINEVERKLNFIAFKFARLRGLNFSRLNTNLFLTIGMPLYRLCGAIYPYLTNIEQVKTQKSVRRMFKKLVGLPQSTSTELINGLIGNMDQILKNQARIS